MRGFPFAQNLRLYYNTYIMLAYLKGTILKKKNKSLIVVANNVGYLVFVLGRVWEKVHEGGEIELFLQHIQREDAQELYGFTQEPDLELFKQLISVSGVGPKSALNVLDRAATGEIMQAVISQDATILTSVSGIGQKTAEKIILELKSKLQQLTKLGLAENLVAPVDSEVADALVGLGYSKPEVKLILQSLPKNLNSTEEKLKAALTLINKK